MKGRVAALGQIGPYRAAALIVDGRLDDFLIEPVEDVPTPGAIYRAVVDRPLKGQGGVMVKLPGTTGFLRQGKGLQPGASLLVQITGYAEDGKAVPVTPKVLFKSRYAIVTPNAPGLNVSRSIKDDESREALLEIAHQEMDESNFGLIVRSSAATAAAKDVGEDIAAMRAMAEHVLADADGSGPELILDGPDPHHLAWREWDAPDMIATEDSAFEDHGVLDLLETLSGPRVALDGGGHMYVEPTRALVAVDVNTGGDMSPAAGLKANIATARDLPRQLRLRGLGGQITIDFAPLAKKDRRQLEQVLRAAFRVDSVETALVGWTPLGHYELQRKRERLPIATQLNKHL